MASGRDPLYGTFGTRRRAAGGGDHKGHGGTGRTRHALQANWGKGCLLRLTGGVGRGDSGQDRREIDVVVTIRLRRVEANVRWCEIQQRLECLICSYNWGNS